MRRTKVAQIYRKTGNLRAVQLLLGHTKMDSTFGTSASDSKTLWQYPRRWRYKGTGRPCADGPHLPFTKALDAAAQLLRSRH